IIYIVGFYYLTENKTVDAYSIALAAYIICALAALSVYMYGVNLKKKCISHLADLKDLSQNEADLAERYENLKDDFKNNQRLGYQKFLIAATLVIAVVFSIYFGYYSVMDNNITKQRVELINQGEYFESLNLSYDYYFDDREENDTLYALENAYDYYNRGEDYLNIANIYLQDAESGKDLTSEINELYCNIESKLNTAIEIKEKKEATTTTEVYTTRRRYYSTSKKSTTTSQSTTKKSTTVNKSTTTEKNTTANNYDSADKKRTTTTSTTKKTTEKSTTTDPYNAKNYRNEEDFYDDHYYDFFDYYDAEKYWKEHKDD
ncbi:MAG: hypothetical protein LIO62_05015, partial [Clostridiales bacterium]|nr:hypothetical protein [Clostridiales bacterium]